VWVVSKKKWADRSPKLLKKLAATANKRTQSPSVRMGLRMDSLMDVSIARTLALEKCDFPHNF
jgi:hypothetical protein